MKRSRTRLLITGGAGFIGYNLVNYLLKKNKYNILNIDKLSYAGYYYKKYPIVSKNYKFVKCDIGNKNKIRKLLNTFKPNKIINLAAESHVDNSINNPSEFIKNNVISIFNFIEEVRNYLQKNKVNDNFIFHHISTDEVYGDLEKNRNAFSEQSPYRPSSPYSASKSSIDHILRAYFRTYNFPVVISICSNNFGPFQNVEKLIPLTINNIIHEKNIPIYGNGKQIRDWIYVLDHVDALERVFKKGIMGETYNISTNNKLSNIEVIKKIIKIFDRDFPRSNKESYSNLIRYVKDRPGHDNKYILNSNKIKKKLNWNLSSSFNKSLELTIKWYIKEINKNEKK